MLERLTGAVGGLSGAEAAGCDGCHRRRPPNELGSPGRRTLGEQGARRPDGSIELSGLEQRNRTPEPDLASAGCRIFRPVRPPHHGTGAEDGGCGNPQGVSELASFIGTWGAAIDCTG